MSVAWQVLGPPPGLQPVDRGYLLVRPEGYKIPQRAIDIHGITNEMAAQVLMSACFVGLHSGVELPDVCVERHTTCIWSSPGAQDLKGLHAAPMTVQYCMRVC